MALDAVLWNLRQTSTEFFIHNPNVNNKDSKNAIVNSCQGRFKNV